MPASVAPSRRRALHLAGGGAAMAALWPHAADAAQPPSLKDAAARAGLRYGADSDIDFSIAPPEYNSLFVQQCGLYAPDVSWGYVCGSSRDCAMPRVDPNIGFAASHGIGLSGGHLLWHENVPGWFASLTPAEARRAAIAHITSMATGYAGRMYAWNVVNEAIEPRDGRADGLRKSVLLDQLGADFFDDSFRAARAADPKCLLAYNDYGMEMERPDDIARRSALLRLLDRLVRQGTPIDAVGLQSHLTMDGTRFDPVSFRGFLRAIAGYKLKILITELDVFDLVTPPLTSARDEAVADLYGQFLEVALDEPAVVAVLTWGISDRYTWLTPRYNPHFVRPDGLPARPLPFDADFQPKPAFHRMIQAFNAAPRR